MVQGKPAGFFRQEADPRREVPMPAGEYFSGLKVP